MTPSQAHDRLIAAVDYELDRYGVAALADLIATMLGERGNREAQRLFQVVAEAAVERGWTK